MTVPVWPSSLPLYPLADGCHVKSDSSQEKKEAFFDLNTFEVATLIKFIDGDLQDGNEPFIFEDPTTGAAVSCKFMDQPSIVPKSDDPRGWKVSCDLEVGTGVKAYDP